MTVFPKWYVYNHANPVEAGTAYEILPGSVAANDTAWGCQGQGCPSAKGSFDLTRFNVSYWQNYERLLRSMQESGVIADIIVFHPYDNGHWGFDCMGGANTTNLARVSRSAVFSQSKSKRVDFIQTSSGQARNQSHKLENTHVNEKTACFCWVWNLTWFDLQGMIPRATTPRTTTHT